MRYNIFIGIYEGCVNKLFFIRTLFGVQRIKILHTSLEET